MLSGLKLMLYIRNRIGLVAVSDGIGILEPKLTTVLGLATLPLETFENIPNRLLAA